MAEVAAPVAIGRCKAEGQMREVPVQTIISEVEGKWHGNTINADVQVSIYAVAHGLGIAIARRGIAVRVLRTYGTRDDERVALGNSGDGIERQRLRRHVCRQGGEHQEYHQICSVKVSTHYARVSLSAQVRVILYIMYLII